MKTLLITGGAGFIGSALVHAVHARGDRVVTVDALTYAALPSTVRELRALPRHELVHADVNDTARVLAVLRRTRPDALVHLAAESHVDRSIDEPDVCVRTNVLGTASLLRAVLAWRDEGGAPERFRLLHVSTDEVFGSLGPDAVSHAGDPYDPRSPYAASKAAADHLVRASFQTHGLPALITHGPNTYGPRQFPEKLVPHMIRRALRGEDLTLYGDGQHRRTWMHVDDHVAGLLAVLERGTEGRSYTLGGGEERTNEALLRQLCAILDAEAPDPGGPHARRITYVADRPGHDRRYAMDGEEVARQTGFRPVRTLAEALPATVRHALAHPETLDAPGYRGERLGLRAVP